MAMLTRLSSSGAAPSSPKALQRFQNCIAFLWPGVNQTQKNSTNIDPIDIFTNELVSQKTRKWEELMTIMKKKEPANGGSSASTTFGLVSKSVMGDIQALKQAQLGLDIRLLSQAQLDNLLLSTLEIKNKVDFLYLITQCIRWRKLPTNEVLVSCLKYLSTLCRLEQIDSFAKICRECEHSVIKTYPDLAPFKAMAMWRSGGADTALNTLHRGYEKCGSEEGRRMIRNAFRTISEETLARKSEAVLVSLMDIAREIYISHKDVFVIACVWKQCFASDWFCDQKTAGDLFEHYKELQQLVSKRSNTLCSSFLGRSNIDAVHRLIEVFLQYDRKDSCANCLSLLFNYQYSRKDLRACAEIVKSCSELEMPLSEMQNEQFLSLFLNQNQPTGTTAKPVRVQKPLKEFQYKF